LLGKKGYVVVVVVEKGRWMKSYTHIVITFTKKTKK